MTSEAHKAVMLKEMLTCLNPDLGEIFIDATFGAGGYSSAILDYTDCQVIALDRDASVVEYADLLTVNYKNRFKFIHKSFNQISQLKDQMESINGIVFDLGVSSMQLDQKERGFSFQKDDKLDMRMDRNSNFTAKNLIDQTNERDLADIIYRFGDERKSRQIAYAIVKNRNYIQTTIQLADIIVGAVGRYNDTIHPATRTFQALRICVNDELNQLREGLKGAAKIVSHGGRIVVITFHSLEDKIVKEFFNELTGRNQSTNRHLPYIQTSNLINFELITKNAIKVSEIEAKLNPRARSAKLRAIKKIT